MVLISLFLVTTFLLTKPSTVQCFVSGTGNVVYMGVPAQVLADGHTQILRCIHRF